MNKNRHGDRQKAGARERAPLIHGIGWGLIGGLAGTLAMDILLIGILSAVDYPPLLCFTIVGDTVSRFFSMFGLQLAGGVSTGVVAHYAIGPIVGIMFGAAAASLPVLRDGTLKKNVLAAVLYVEILSQPLLATTPILLKMTTPETLQWFGGSFVMHLLYGGCSRRIVGYGLRSSHWRPEGEFNESPDRICQPKPNVPVTDDETRRGYLERAYELGKDFARVKLKGKSMKLANNANPGGNVHTGVVGGRPGRLGFECLLWSAQHPGDAKPATALRPGWVRLRPEHASSCWMYPFCSP